MRLTNPAKRDKNSLGAPAPAPVPLARAPSVSGAPLPAEPDEGVYQAVRAGAKAYLLKDAPLSELLTCIRDVHTGRTCIPPALAAKLAARMSGQAPTTREADVLKLAAGRSNKEIGSTLFISETTVKTHIRSIFAKLNVLSRTEAIAAATHRGFIRL